MIQLWMMLCLQVLTAKGTTVNTTVGCRAQVARSQKSLSLEQLHVSSRCNHVCYLKINQHCQQSKKDVRRRMSGPGWCDLYDSVRIIKDSHLENWTVQAPC